MAEFTVTVSNNKGFHLRPASKLLQLVSEFADAQIVIHHDESGRSADCRNMMALMMMSSPQGTVFRVVIDAESSQKDVITKAISDLFDQGFGDET